MKRRSQTSNLPSSPLLKSQIKIQSRSTHKPKSTKNGPEKVKKNRKIKSSEEPIQDYLIIDGNVFQASTETERKQVSTYVNRFKREAIYEKSLKSHPTKKKNTCERVPEVQIQAQSDGKHVQIEELVRNLPVEQKISLMRQLQREFNNNPEFLAQGDMDNSVGQSRLSSGSREAERSRSGERDRESVKVVQEKQSEQKYNLLNLKLQGFQQQLQQKRQLQIQKINRLFYQGQLTASQRKHKISSIDKVKDRKTKIINCTRNLFYTLLHNKFEPEYFRNGNIDEAIRELDSFSELELVDREAGRERDGDGDRDREYTKLEGESSIQSQLEFQKIGGEVRSADKYDRIEDRMEGSDKKSVNEQSLLISPDKSAQKADREKELSSQKDKQRQKENNMNFQCSQQSISVARKLQIPLLLTKQKIEQLQWQKKTKAIQKMRVEVDRKISFQMSELELQIDQARNHFTTLADINGFIMALYEYIIRKDLEHVVSRLNMPYGKATRDKLFLLQQNGDIDELEYYSVLDQSHLNGFNMETAQTVRKFSEQEKVHNKAVFDSFNMHLNAYRPYFQLEGDVYPWFVSEKGLTFYEINEENIEEVFQKTKIKVLQQCSTLCGVLPFGINERQAPQILKEKNNENFQKEQKLSLVETFPKWSIKLMDYDTMVRLLLTQQIINKQIQDCVRDLRRL